MLKKINFTTSLRFINTLASLYAMSYTVIDLKINEDTQFKRILITQKCGDIFATVSIIFTKRTMYLAAKTYDLTTLAHFLAVQDQKLGRKGFPLTGYFI